MPGACDCNDEASKDVKCCFFLPSFMSFKILAWLNIIQMIMALFVTCAVLAMFVGIGAAAANDGAFDGMSAGMPSGMPSGMSSGVSGGAAAAGSLVAVVMVIVLLMTLFSVVATCMFVCCDSAKARKLYAIALVLGGLVGVGAAGKITAGGVL